MPFRVFTIPTRDDGSFADELNQFMRSHGVLQVEKRFIDEGSNSFWSFCIDYVETQTINRQTKGPANRQRIDYKGSNRVNRGGSWNNAPVNCRSANRNRNTPDNRNNNLGFRVSLSSASAMDFAGTEPTIIPSQTSRQR